VRSRRRGFISCCDEKSENRTTGNRGSACPYFFCFSEPISTYLDSRPGAPFLSISKYEGATFLACFARSGMRKSFDSAPLRSRLRPAAQTLPKLRRLSPAGPIVPRPIPPKPGGWDPVHAKVCGRVGRRLAKNQRPSTECWWPFSFGLIRLIGGSCGWRVGGHAGIHQRALQAELFVHQLF
jgi:hypothetical protein